jgi:histidyl-tRNA synthetase
MHQELASAPPESATSRGRPGTKVARVRGTQDLIGDGAERFDRVIAAFERLRRLYGFRSVQLPVFEFTSVFARSLGETTDVVSKEMYSFEDRNGESLTLRPEFTAAIARAYITGGWQQHAPLKLATAGPLFRYERPQKGRYRQFHQLDAEVVGAGEPAADVELVAFAQQLLEELGVAGRTTLQLNTLGDSATRQAWREALVSYFGRHRDALSAESRDRLERNPLRILDSKDDADRALVAEAPVIDAYLTAEAGAFFERLQAGLASAGVSFVREPRLVRGFDYYRHTAFEFVTEHLGAQGTVIGGGRYDGLVEALGGPPTPAVGWAAGIERLSMLIEAPAPPVVDVAVVPLGPAAEIAALGVLQQLRRAGIAAEQGWRGNLKKRMARADASGARLAIILGDDELAQGRAALKDLRSGSQTLVELSELAQTVARA